jgi:hypothetical protein
MSEETFLYFYKPSGKICYRLVWYMRNWSPPEGFVQVNYNDVPDQVTFIIVGTLNEAKECGFTEPVPER